MDAVEAALASGQSSVNVAVQRLSLPDNVQMTNGGTGPYNGSLLLITSGRGSLPPSLVLVNPRSPYNTTVLLNNYYGRQFNSLNDGKIHPSGKIFFTDAPYGNVLGFRPAPAMPNQVYRFDPVTKDVRVVAGDFTICQWHCVRFCRNYRICVGRLVAPPNWQTDLNMFLLSHRSDTGSTGGSTRPSSIYAFDVDPITHAFTNRRIFAYSDTGIPDGLQVDAQGNVYSGADDGVHVWNSRGTLLGKFVTGQVSANMAFAGDGRLVILAETKVFVAKIAAKPSSVVYPR
ncbi:calcium-dependent phosphotriesterase [Coprinellus micaceus]|uniref:Calcium-dependent phosphotriesterase n=1 Tax=Coprinellus micaceus TaxID=71717 RepID=A0A4Y7SU19_COPMI|nr:calcium-dependent phosphotriesterase [Coprinellus micaceus]